MNFRDIIIILLISSSEGYAQWISDIKTESDWEYYLDNGYIDYNSYRLLKEIADGAEIKDTSEFIISTLGISPIEMTEELAAAKVLDLGSNRLLMRKLNFIESGIFRFGSEIRDNKNENFILASLRSRDLTLGFKFRNEDSQFLPERRSVELNKDKYSISLGNFTADVGCGLSLGRFDYRPVSFEPKENNINEFLFPDNSFYNGLKVEFLQSHSLVYSVKKYNDLYKTTFGAVLTKRLRPVQLGVTGALTRLASGSSHRNMGVGSVFVDYDEKKTRAEIAYGESGLGACVQIIRPDFILKGWYYHDSYINLQSSGFSHPDYRSFTEVNSEISFRQSQSGESGFFARKDLEYKRLAFKNAAEFWRNPRTGHINNNYSARLKIYVSSNVSTYMGYSVYSGDNSYRNKFELGIQTSKKYGFDARLLVTIEKNSIADKGSAFYILAWLPVMKCMSLAGRFRWYLNNSFDYYLEEQLILFGNLSAKATYRWKDAFGRDLGSLYIVVESRF